MGPNGASAPLQWWADHLKDLTVSPLTRDYPEQTSETNVKRPIDAVESLSTSENLKKSLSTLAQYGAPSHVIQAAFVVLVARLTGDEDIAVGASTKSGGKPFVLRLSYTPSESFPALIAKVTNSVKQAEGSAVSLDALRAHLSTDTLFRFAAFHASSPGEDVAESGRNVDLLLIYHITATSSVHLQARYNQRLFSSGRIRGILAQLECLIENAAADTSTTVGAILFSTPEEKSLLPDPTSDLEWSSFRGAIQDIFTANAEAHPDRVCIVETTSGTNPERIFSYKHINEASNILAHHLVQSGIERGDVVMVYSHRGVDLVVAVFGILKAGATFSVLDPAYPPDRQNIYLEVAKPRGLVIIEKATKEAGELADQVQSFISQNLHLKTQVPALALQDDGALLGGASTGADMFDSVRQLKAQSPGVVVGPDSHPTLSFTSGSEGKPKGVLGRHFSLAFYFDWMAKTFKLSREDKFTMLSGIAHDPIQRDMFTPLFLGAQLLVPSRDDIQNEKLAEWMKTHGATVTHLTPAMGQILVGGASARFDALHHAFFVGDILIKRDCRSLQSLAPNVAIVNMYGTTETQRAVSYFEIPSLHAREGYLDGMKDVIPAGRGMYNIQMLVVNRFDTSKLCAVGEIGEIYVRASGLAEGYLGTPELTAKKFVMNWFPGHEKGVQQDQKRFEAGLNKEPWAKYYRGPRDRLYRSGDLGRYTPTGEVECSGRADDQVKIRGFRIELGEIDTHLSQHELVRENVTLVRRDKFEEQTLVSYVVPQMKTWLPFLVKQGLEDQPDDGSLPGRFERFRLLQQAIRQHLEKKLPAYAVPSMIVPMRAMPLNPNGKVDKPKLPFPDPTLLSATRRRKSSMMAQLTETELGLGKVWAKLIPGTVAKGIKPSETFFDIGGNSMTAQQLPFYIRRTWPGVDIRISSIYNQPSLKHMAANIDRALAKDSLEGGWGDTADTAVQTKDASTDSAYADDALLLAGSLPKVFPEAMPVDKSTDASPTVFLTGVTGYLGAFILRDLMTREKPRVRIIVLVRAKDAQHAVDRVRNTCTAYGVWSDAWLSRLRCLEGSLGERNLGLVDEHWSFLRQTVDVVIHNGAQVHWINPYKTLKPSNVQGTIDALRLCASGKPKHFAFVSSTAVLDTDHYVHESERIISAGGEGISEEDDLEGSRTTLGTGYGQSKWVAEYLVREAGKRGLQGCIIRPGYVLGDSVTGVTNTDDFLIRMLKGCVQLRARPNINNTVNMVPVDHVARVVVACAFHSTSMRVAHVTGHPRLRFNQFLAALETYGYHVPLVDYVPWTGELENYVTKATDPHALMPLFTFVVNDLPANTRAPELDDANAEEALYADRKWSGQDVSAGTGVTKNLVGLYLAYLVKIGFMPPPTVNGSHANGTHHTRDKSMKVLPDLIISTAQKAALTTVGGRGALA